MTTSKADKKPQTESLRRKQASRMAAVQAMYGRHFSEDEAAHTVDAWADAIMEHCRADFKSGADELGLDAVPERALLLTLLESALAHESAIVELVEESMGETWASERAGPLLQAILMIAVAEMKARPDKNATIIISEYVSLTERFMDDGEVGFVNGILATISQKIRA